MPLLAGLLAYAGRFVGRVLTMGFSWATVLLFGRVPQSKQLLLSGIALGSIAWVVAIVGTVVPEVGAMVFALTRVPEQYEEYVRIAMIVAALVIPILVGIGGFFMLDAADRPRGMGMVKQVLRGYPYCLVLAFTLVFMFVLAPVRKLRSLAKRWTDAHIPVVIKPGGYDQVAADIERALDGAALEIDRRGAPRVLEAPSKLLGMVGGAGVNSLVPDRLILLANRDLEVLVYPSDISVAGKKDQLARARAAVASRLMFTSAYLTTTKETQEIEDRLERLMHSVPAAKKVAEKSGPAQAGDGGGVAGGTAGVEHADGVADAGSASRDRIAAELREIDEALANLDVMYDEWEVLYRLRLQVERDILAASEGAAETAREQQRAAAEPSPPPFVAHAAASSMGLVERLVAKTPLPSLFRSLHRQAAEPPSRSRRT